MEVTLVSGMREDTGMPLFIGVSVISFITLSIIYIFDITISNDILLGIKTVSPFVGAFYVAAGWIFGSLVRIGTGLSLTFLGAVDLGLSESLSSSAQILLVIIGALTPI